MITHLLLYHFYFLCIVHSATFIGSVLMIVIIMQGSRRAKTCWLNYIISPVLIKALIDFLDYHLCSNKRVLSLVGSILTIRISGKTLSIWSNRPSHIISGRLMKPKMYGSEKNLVNDVLLVRYLLKIPKHCVRCFSMFILYLKYARKKNYLL